MRKSRLDKKHPKKINPSCAKCDTALTQDVLDIVTKPIVVLRLRIAMYSALIVLSFFILTNISKMQEEGHMIKYCPLYVTISDTTTVKKPPPDSTCGYILTISIIFQCVYLMCRVAMLTALKIDQLSYDFVMFKDVMEIAYLVIDFFLFFLTFIGACILSVGLNSTCKTLNCDDHDYDFESPGKFAKIGAFISTPMWLFIFLVGFIFLFRAGKIPFLRSGGRKPPDSKPPGSIANLDTRSTMIETTQRTTLSTTATKTTTTTSDESTTTETSTSTLKIRRF